MSFYPLVYKLHNQNPKNHVLLNVISHGMLMSCGWNTLVCLCCFVLCFIYDTSQYFMVAWFSVCLSFYPLVYKLHTPKTLKNLFLLFLFIEIVLACSLVVWEQFIALTSLASFPGTKLDHTFLGLLIIQLVLRGGLKPTNF